MQKVLALGSSGTVRKTSSTFKVRPQPNSSAIMNLALSDTLLLESPTDIAEAFDSYFTFILINDKLLIYEIHLILTLAMFSSISLEVAEVMAVMKCAKPSGRLGSDCIPPAVFRTVGPGLHLPLLIIYRSVHVSRYFPVTTADLRHPSTSQEGFFA